jgi:hypothetical protein
MNRVKEPYIIIIAEIEERCRMYEGLVGKDVAKESDVNVVGV